ncbi:ethanolamine utilization cobalamin adenosyltransferase [Desulfosporosinus orientis DSM 765]|uniref:Ethanolamine utilization cobalamin adenosyltransferase n=1 Tax=Desulfosporosinus orientis (strain ATCC 19365 / DSM 765 / NCIMB 8382 / VKM B-1628 / Singapore I) TaxID=768706 RepID=G7WEI0_DESOD|nr:ethanolamine utilization cobalamin adenosyltransferase [Desulfosporosinus orientis]AET70793.1 ethanolamine utilization cobalamin adenosyltransferase [Desulfosporosinus orientis DSM 765]
MKFITEMELREVYRREPFTTYVMEPDTRITPGARQFLVDRRVTLSETQPGDEETVNLDSPQQVQVEKTRCSQRLLRKMERMESLFLLMAAEVGSGEAILSEEVLALGRYFQKVRRAEEEQRAPDTLQFWGWSAEEIKERSAGLEEQVDISEFHLELEKGRDVAVLNYLRASLRELEPEILEIYWREEQSVCSRQDLIDAIAGIINILSMMIEKYVGGRKWKS